MRIKKFILISAVIAIMCLTLFPCSAFAAKEKIFDEENLFSDTQKAILEENLQKFYDEHNVELIVLTKNVSKYGLSDFFKGFSKTYKTELDIGSKNMFVLLISPSESPLNRIAYIYGTGDFEKTLSFEQLSDSYDILNEYMVYGDYYSVVNAYASQMELNLEYSGTIEIAFYIKIAVVIFLPILIFFASYTETKKKYETQIITQEKTYAYKELGKIAIYKNLNVPKFGNVYEAADHYLKESDNSTLF